MTRKLTNEEFIQKATARHGDRYDYGKVEFKNTRSKVAITCPDHGEFTQNAKSHLEGSGCMQCHIIGQRKGTRKFIELAREVHGDLYSYSTTEYKQVHTKVSIECPRHGVFWQVPHSHLRGSGCNKCGIESTRGPRVSTDEWIDRFRTSHGDRYMYDKVDYVSAKKNMLIGCRIHGYFKQRPFTHLNARGECCPKCYATKGEAAVFQSLDRLGVEYECQAGFTSCRRLVHLSFDFFLPNHALLIEFDGEQHFRASWSFGGEEMFQYRKELDEIKNQWARTHGIPLVRLRDIHLPRIDTILEKLLSRRVGVRCPQFVLDDLT